MAAYQSRLTTGCLVKSRPCNWVQQKHLRSSILHHQPFTRRGASSAAAAVRTNDAPAPATRSAVLHRNIKVTPMQVVEAKGTRMRFDNGHEMEDTTCGAAVACLGHGNARVRQAMIDQIDKFSYCNSMFFGHQVGEDLATELINGTGGAMAKAYIMSSGLSCRQYESRGTS